MTWDNLTHLTHLAHLSRVGLLDDDVRGRGALTSHEPSSSNEGGIGTSAQAPEVVVVVRQQQLTTRYIPPARASTGLGAEGLNGRLTACFTARLRIIRGALDNEASRTGA